MTVAELIEKLRTMPQDVPVECEYSGPGGCDTCGYGSGEESDIEHVLDLETRVVLSVLSSPECKP